MFGAHADMEVGAEGFSHLFAEKSAKGLSCDPANHLADQIALGHGMIAWRRARFPIRGLGRQQAGGFFPVIKISLLEGLFPARQSGRMAHKMADLDPGLSIGGKFWPIFRHRRVKIQIAAISQHQGNQKGHGLGRRIDIDDGVFFPGPGLGLIGKAAPDIDHGLAVLGGAIARANISAIIQIGFKRLAHAQKPVLRKPVCFNCGHIVPLCRRLIAALRLDYRIE